MDGDPSLGTNDYVPDRLGQTVKIRGVVTSGDLRGEDVSGERADDEIAADTCAGRGADTRCGRRIVALIFGQVVGRRIVERGTADALPALALATALVAAPIGLIVNRISRAIERRADEFSLELSDAPQAFISFEQRIAVRNVADVTPPRWFTDLLATHPQTLERIGAAVGYSRG